MMNVLLDSLMALLLLFTIFVCWKLNGRIKVLQDSKEELAETIREFDACTQRAAKSIAEIHTATQRISENIQHKIDKASFIADDLEIMISRGNKIMGGGTGAKPAAKKETRAATRKPVERKPAASKRKPRAAFVEDPNAEVVDIAEEAAPKPTPEAAPRARTKAEQDLMDAVKTANDEVV